VEQLTSNLWLFLAASFGNTGSSAQEHREPQGSSEPSWTLGCGCSTKNSNIFYGWKSCTSFHCWWKESTLEPIILRTFWSSRLEDIERITIGHSRNMLKYIKIRIAK
jgi:hypothetical protein